MRRRFYPFLISSYPTLYKESTASFCSHRQSLPKPYLGFPDFVLVALDFAKNRVSLKLLPRRSSSPSVPLRLCCLHLRVRIIEGFAVTPSPSPEDLYVAINPAVPKPDHAAVVDLLLPVSPACSGGVPCVP